MKKILMILVTLCCLSSCSGVFEDRDACPCWLTLDFSQMPREVEQVHLWVLNDENSYDDYTDLFVTDFTRPVVVKTRKSEFTDVCVWCNLKKSRITGSDAKTLISVLPDKDADSLFKEVVRLDTRCESITHVVDVSKEYCHVTLMFNRTVGLDDKFQIAVHQDVSGFYIAGVPYLQPRTYTLGDTFTIRENVRYDFNIFRGSLNDELYVAVNVRYADGHEGTFYYPLGDMLVEKGYDMTKKFLDDVTFYIDDSYNIFNTVIEPWTTQDPAIIEF